MIYDADRGLWYMAVFWLTVTAVFGVSLHIAIKLAQIELERTPKLVIIVVSSLTGLIPAVGPYLAFVVAIFLIYKATDTSLGMVVAVVIVTRSVAIVIAIVALKALAAAGLIEE